MTKQARRQADVVYTSLGIRVDRHEASVETAVHLDARGERPVFDRPTDPVYASKSNVDIYGICTSPQERNGEQFRLTFIGEIATEPPLQLKDIQARNERFVPVYKQYRGATYPVYVAPKGVAMLDHMREPKGWSAYVFAVPQLLSDMLVLLGGPRQLYLSIHEKKAERQRWIQSVSLQTTDPAIE